jgi:hypothetical protein
VIAVGLFPEDLVQQIGTAVDHQVLLDEVRGRVDAPQYLQHLQSIEGAVAVMHRLQNLDGALLGGFITLLGCQG